MLRRTPRLDQFERDWIAASSRDYAANLRVFEALYNEAVALGVLPPKNRLEGIEVDIALARFLNDRRPPRLDR